MGVHDPTEHSAGMTNHRGRNIPPTESSSFDRPGLLWKVVLDHDACVTKPNDSRRTQKTRQLGTSTCIGSVPQQFDGSHSVQIRVWGKPAAATHRRASHHVRLQWNPHRDPQFPSPSFTQLLMSVNRSRCRFLTRIFFFFWIYTSFATGSLWLNSIADLGAIQRIVT